MFDALTQDIDHAPLGDFSLKSCQELQPRRTVTGESQLLVDFWLGSAKKAQQLGQIHCMVTVVVLRSPANPASTTVGYLRLIHLLGRSSHGIAGRSGQRGADHPFEAAFAGVGVHRCPLHQLPIN